jgi:hypothetical protein
VTCNPNVATLLSRCLCSFNVRQLCKLRFAFLHLVSSLFVHIFPRRCCIFTSLTGPSVASVDMPGPSNKTNQQSTTGRERRPSEKVTQQGAFTRSLAPSFSFILPQFNPSERKRMQSVKQLNVLSNGRVRKLRHSTRLLNIRRPTQTRKNVSPMYCNAVNSALTFLTATNRVAAANLRVVTGPDPAVCPLLSSQPHRLTNVEPCLVRAGFYYDTSLRPSQMYNCRPCCISQP